MREVVFRLEAERPGHVEAHAEGLPIRISAPTLEELQHEAREALIAHMGPAHCTVRVRVRRSHGAAVSSIRPVIRPAAVAPGPVVPAAVVPAVIRRAGCR